MRNRLNRRFAVRGPGHHLCSKHGFTLTELVIILAIIGIILATAISMGINMRKTRALSQAADELVYQLQRAKLTAIKEFTPTSIILGDDGRHYFLDRNSTCIRTEEAQDFSLRSAGSGVVFDDPDYSNFVSDSCVTFIPSGVVITASKFYIADKDDGLKYRIRISGAGGISKHIFNKNDLSWYQPGEK